MDALTIGAAGAASAINRFSASAQRTVAGTGDPVSETVAQIGDKAAFDASLAVVKTSEAMSRRLLDMKV